MVIEILPTKLKRSQLGQGRGSAGYSESINPRTKIKLNMEASFQRIKKNLFGGISTEGGIIRIHNLIDFICVQLKQREKVER